MPAGQHIYVGNPEIDGNMLIEGAPADVVRAICMSAPMAAILTHPHFLQLRIEPHGPVTLRLSTHQPAKDGHAALALQLQTAAQMAKRGDEASLSAAKRRHLRVVEQAELRERMKDDADAIEGAVGAASGSPVAVRPLAHHDVVMANEGDDG
jgi:hypothetical protein